VGAIFSKNSVPIAVKAAEPPDLGSPSLIMKARQSAKLRELRRVLIDDGCVGLCKQAAALGIRRSTAWVVLNGRHKSSGLSALIVDRMLTSPKLPPQARRVLQEYIEEKSAGLYGHDKKSVTVFRRKLSLLKNQNAGWNIRTISTAPGATTEIADLGKEVSHHQGEVAGF
jgi:hypothetical protein